MVEEQLNKLSISEKAAHKFVYSPDDTELIRIARDWPPGKLAIAREPDTLGHIILNKMIEQYIEWPADDDPSVFETLPVFSCSSNLMHMVAAKQSNIHKTHLAGYDYPVCIDLVTAELIEGFEYEVRVIHGVSEQEESLPGKKVELLLGIALLGENVTERLGTRMTEMSEQQRAAREQQDYAMKFMLLQDLTEGLVKYMERHIIRTMPSNTLPQK